MPPILALAGSGSLTGFGAGLSSFRRRAGGAFNTGPTRVVVFNYTQNWTSPTDVTLVDYLIVGGGGAGGYWHGGGGGAGGLITGVDFPISAATPYTVTIGSGGTAVQSGPGAPAGSAGSNSVFSTMTAIGGGAGGTRYTNTSGGNGGSGGGGGYFGSNGTAIGTPSNPVQGTAGGPGGHHGGGGGGANTAGGGSQSYDPNRGGRGGEGYFSTITGANTAYAGGGGGGDQTNTAEGYGAPGGSGGGGQGNANPVGQAGSGAPNTGGGGGGAGGSPNPTGNGGSGVVILRFKSSVVPKTFEYLVVGGGGAGGGPSSAGTGGAGAGGFILSFGTASSPFASANGVLYETSPVSYTVTVGAGGAAVSQGGSNSSITSPSPNWPSIIAFGGGRGGEGGDESGNDSAAGGMPYGPATGTPFACGGGAGRGGYPRARCTPWQGNEGGDGQNLPYYGGGGGGAGSVGGSNPINPSIPLGRGGSGVTTPFSGTPASYCGGGSGSGPSGREPTNTGGAPSGNGEPNTGGGGGAYATGGSGVVIIRYDSSIANVSTTGSPTYSNPGTYKIYKWTGAGSFTFTS